MSSRNFAVVATRRIWSAAEKQRIVDEASVPGVNISAVARNNGVAQSLLYRWRKDAATGASATSQVFVPVALTTGQSPVPQTAAKEVRPKSSPASSRPAISTSLIEVVLEGGRTLRIAPDIEPQVLVRILAILKANP